MKFRLKTYDNGITIIKEVNEHPGVIERGLEKRFFADNTVARFEQMKMADGRICFSLKDRYNKIIIQYKQV